MFSKLTWWRSNFESPLLRICIVAILLLVALVPRFSDLPTEEPQPDELHWRMRSAHVLERFKSGDFSHATTYIGHPGVPPALVMAASQELARRAGEKTSLKLDPLAASRFGCAAVSSLAPVVLFLGAAPVTGTVAALAGALLLAFDPYHIGVSRMAHLDGVMSLLVLLTILSYFRAVSRQSGGWYVISGIFWGLSILSKPTAVLLIPAIFLWKSLERLVGRNNRIKLIDPFDLVVLLVGHVVLALLFTRLWVHNSEYLRRLKVYSQLADSIYSTGMALQSHPLASFAALAAAAILGLYVFYLPARNISRASGSFGSRQDWGIVFLVIFALASALVSFPQVLESIVRFWYWVFGLSGQNHRAWGEVHQPPVGGYPILFLSRLPVLTVVSFLVGVVWCILDLFDRRRRRDHILGRGSIGLLVALAILIWGGFLSISSKQALRYLLPAVVPAMILAGIGWSEIGAWLFDRPPAEKFGRLSRIKLKLAAPLLALMMLGAVEGAVDAYPNYFLYFNRLSGGLKTGVQRQSSMPVVGQVQTVSYLNDRAAEARHGLTVAVYGDLELLTYVYRRYFNSRQFPIRFIFSSSLIDADYLAVFPFARTTVLGPIRSHIAPVFKYGVDDIVFVRLYKVLPFDFKVPYSMPLTQASHPSGRLEYPQGDKGGPVIVARPRESKKGFVYAASANTAAGRFKMTFSLRLPAAPPVDPELTGDRLAARLDFGKECSRTITVADLQQPSDQFSLECDLQKEGRKSIRIYWFGNVPLEIRSAVISAAAPLPDP